MRTSSLLLSAAFLLVGCGSNDTSTSGQAGNGGSGGTGGAGGSGGTGGGKACASDVTPEPGTAVTETGAVTGEKAGTTWVYKGIPYAAPPTGDLRFKAPEPHACWDSPLMATEYGAICPQQDESGAVVGDEDCLTLNIWSPEDASAEDPVSVLFFIHGGGNTQGSSAVNVAGTYLYDGQALSEQGHVAVVTINYRIGPLGWLSHPSFAPEGAPNQTGNYGALDQVFALAWVKANIGAFGGDPSKVLVFGESAGGQNTCLMLATPLAKDLFSGALIESGGCSAQSQSDAETTAHDWAGKAGCEQDPDPAACMRALSAEDVILLAPAPVEVAGKQGPYQPHIDGYLLPEHPYDMLEKGTHNHVPLVVGANENETGATVPDMTEAEYDLAVQTLFTTLADQVLMQYPVANYPTPRDAYVALTSDAKFICTARRTVRAARGSQSEPVFRYHFTHVLDNVGPAGKAKGAFHGVELFFVFNKLTVANYVPSAQEKALATEIGGYWSRFGQSGDPNGGASVMWPSYEIATDPYLRLDNTITAEEGVHTANCDFWDALLTAP